VCERKGPHAEERQRVPAILGSLAAGHPLVGYVLGGELLARGVSLVAATALLVSGVTVGVVQLPAEALLLGRRFAIVRNLHPGAVRLDPGVRMAQRPRDAALRNQDRNRLLNRRAAGQRPSERSDRDMLTQASPPIQPPPGHSTSFPCSTCGTVGPARLSG